jgi:hypothetical protein
MHERETRARRPRHVRAFLAQVVGIVGRWFHFAGRFGRGRRATAFGDIPFKPEGCQLLRVKPLVPAEKENP